MDVCAGGNRLAGTALLGIAIADLAPQSAARLRECCARGADLAAAYQESADYPVRVSARWRVTQPSSLPQRLATVELIVSVETSLLDSSPQLTVNSTLPAHDALCLIDAATAEYRALELRPGQPKTIESGDGAGCLLVRLPGAGLSYAEAVHPSDFLGAELRAQAGRISLSHQLFAQRLEKGVILRARVGGVFLTRAGDAELAASWYRDFSAAEPPLSA
jgi:hypothetical protein